MPRRFASPLGCLLAVAFICLTHLHPAQGAITAGGSTIGDPATTDYQIGTGGLGTYTVNGGSTASFASHLYVGYDDTGTLTVDAAVVTVTSSLRVGETGTADGMVIATNGAAIASTGGLIGTSAGANGTVTIDGSGTALTAATTLTVGVSGDGTLNITDGASVGVTIHIALGQNATGMGSVTVDGAALSSGNVAVGMLGNGALTIQNGAGVSLTGGMTLGAFAGGVGGAMVDGGGTTVAAGSLTVGLSGDGTLNITDGASVSMTTDVVVGSDVTGSGSVTVDGAALSGDDATIGDSGDGSLTVRNAADTDFTGNVTLGENSGSVGEVTVDGSGTAFTAHRLTVGLGGNATFDVMDGASVDVTTDISVGQSTTSTAVMTVDGSGSALSSDDAMIGGVGDGTLTLSNGADASFAGNVVVALGATSTGVITVDGGGTTMIAGSVELGVGGDGTLIVRNAGAVNVTGAMALGSAGGVTVEGAGSALSLGGVLSLGGAGSAVEVKSGGVLTADEITLASGTSLTLSNGTVTATDGLVSDGTLSGQGTINGDVALNANAAGGSSADLIFNGFVTGVGSITGRVRFNGGYSPGNSPAQVTLGSPTFEAGNTLTMEVGGTTPGTDHDQIIVAGTGALGGTLEVDLINSFTPGVSDTFELIATSGSGVLTGSFAVLDVPTVSGLVFQVTQDGERVLLWLVDAASFGGIDAAVSEREKAVQGALNRIITEGTTNVDLADLAQDVAVLPTAAQQRAALYALSGQTVRQALEMGAIAAEAGFANVRSRLRPGRDGIGSEVRVGTFSDAQSVDFEDDRLASYLDAPNEEPMRERAETGPWLESDRYGWSAFAIGGYTHAKRGATADQSAYASDQFDLTVGVDRWLADDKTRIGAAVGWVTTDSDNRDGTGGSEAEVYSVIAFASHDVREDVRLVGSVSYGYADYDLTRNVVFSGVNLTAEGDTHGDIFSADAGVIYHKVWGGVEVLPQAYLQYVGERVAGYSETGAGAAGLDVDSQTWHSLTSTLMVEVAKTVEVARVRLRPSVHVGWEHQFLDDEDRVGTSFVGDPSIRFDTLVDGSVTDALTFGAGLSCAVGERVGVYVDYEGRLGEQDSESHRVEVGVRVAF